MKKRPNPKVEVMRTAKPKTVECWAPYDVETGEIYLNPSATQEEMPAYWKDIYGEKTLAVCRVRITPIVPRRRKAVRK